jgi:hypothetical protein
MYLDWYGPKMVQCRFLRTVPKCAQLWEDTHNAAVSLTQLATQPGKIEALVRNGEPLLATSLWTFGEVDLTNSVSPDSHSFVVVKRKSALHYRMVDLVRNDRNRVTDKDVAVVLSHMIPYAQMKSAHHGRNFLPGGIYHATTMDDGTAHALAMTEAISTNTPCESGFAYMKFSINRSADNVGMATVSTTVQAKKNGTSSDLAGLGPEELEIEVANAKSKAVWYGNQFDEDRKQKNDKRKK